MMFSIRDTGIGISYADQQRILAGFYRTEESRRVARGVGVGLRVTRELLERHGSRLQFESEPGKGSRFFFYLPFWPQSSSA
jgi:signal transduction histidine kinase